MSRHRAALLVIAGIGGAVACGLLVGGLAKLAAPLEGAGPLAWLLAVLILLGSVAGLIGILVSMYALYALIRGPSASAMESRE